MCVKNLSNINLYHILSSLVSNDMKKEYIFTKDKELKAKEYLDLCFDTKVSFDEFNEWYEKYRKYINPEVVLEFHDAFELHKLAISQYQESEVLDVVKIEDNEVIFNAVNYVRYLILATLCNSWDCDNKMRNEIWLLLMRDMTEIYTAKWEQWSNLLATLKHYSRMDPFRFYMYTDYIKYNHDAKYKWWLKYKKWRIELINRKLKEDPKLLEKLNDIKYERKLEKNNILDYIIYCTLFLGEDLYIVYCDINEWWSYNIKITNKNRLWDYLSDWVYVLDVSSIILNFYNTVVIHAFDWTDFLELAQKKRKSEKEWEKLFHDILEDSKSKNKITFNVESKNETPVFMSSKWIEQDLNKYKLIEDELWENWEITKKRSKWKWNALWIVKRRVYWSKKAKS